MIEKGLTENRMTDGPEHMGSVDCDGAKDFVDRCREVSVALGRPRRISDHMGHVNRRSLYTVKGKKLWMRPRKS